MLLKKLCKSAVVIGHFQNALPTQRLDDLRVTHQSQVTCCGLSYKSILFSSATIPGETFHFPKRFAVIREEGPAEGLFDKEPAPLPILPLTSWHNGRSPQERLRNIIKLLHMKVRGMSLWIDVSHRDFPIAALAGRLGNSH